MTDEQMKEGGYKRYDISRKDDNTVVIEAEYDLDSDKFKNSDDKDWKDYDKAKKYFEDNGLKCKD